MKQKDKILKLSFKNEAAWKQVEETLFDEMEDNKVFKAGIKSTIPLGHMQKPPATDWTPDPANLDDNGWGVYDDWAVDVVVEAGFDYTDLKQYLIKEPHSVGHTIKGDYEIIYKV